MQLPLPDQGERFEVLAAWCARGLRTKLEPLHAEPGSQLAFAIAGREQALRALDDLRRENAWVLLPQDPGWPPIFERTDPPVGPLFIRGELDLSSPSLAIVGSRHATPYGLTFATELAAALAADGCIVVSGGAMGIDGAAHRGGLSTGRTTVVLGGSVDRLYPRQHRGLFEDVLAHGGCVVSEAPFGTPAHPGLFPRRNRIIAALSRAVVIVQAARHSGSLITARLAAKLDLPVLAVPGAPGDAVAEGTKDLLRAGATLCLGPEEVRRVLNLAEPESPRSAKRARPSRAQSDPTLTRLGRVLGVSPRPIDDLALAAGLSPQRTAVAMTRLELAGLATRSPGGGFHRSVPSKVPSLQKDQP